MMFWFPWEAVGQIPVCSLGFGVNSGFNLLGFIIIIIFLNLSSELKILTWEEPGPTWNSAPEWAESSPACHKRCCDKWVKIWNYVHKTWCALLPPHCSSMVSVGGGTYTAYSRLPEFGPKRVNLWAVTPQSALFFFNSDSRVWGNILAIHHMVSSPLLLLKRNIFNTNLRDKSGSCACAATAFPRISMGFFSFVMYLNTYLQNSGFSLPGEENGGEKALKIRYI